MYNIFKRFFDIVSSLVVIVFLSPLFFVIIIVLKLSGEGEVFYFQERIGLNNKNFFVYKFVTMVKNSPNLGSGIYTSSNDSRILPFGHFLRKTKLNELPQLFNVLLGDMSVIGPRPLIERTFLLYNDEVQSEIYKHKPGLSGIGSIVFRDEENLLSTTNLPLEEFYEKNISPLKGELEGWYNNNISFKVDIIIIFITIWVIIFPNSILIYKIFSDLPKYKK